MLIIELWYDMFFCFRTGALIFLSLVTFSLSHAQSDRPLQLNGVLYEVVPGADEGSQRAFLWSLELQELSKSYEQVVESSQRKRVNILFYSQTSGRDWRKYWSERMRLVYLRNPEMVNDHAEGFFTISGSFPETFESGDRFSLESEADGATRAYFNDQLIAQSLKPGHFEFWLRAWHTGVMMPDIFRGNLLAGGSVPEDLLVAYRNSELPRPVRVAPEQQSQRSDSASASMVQGESSVLDENEERVVYEEVMPVIVGSQEEMLGW